jgi:phosphatidylserine/phosphatidylglycerophosphate/cardiolipin synthase-like enzyme
LSWDFAVVFALDREILPLYRLPWRSHRRLRLVLDADHPPAGSHHQKVVVIDDKVAFCGGIDITTSRWDTREHPADPAKRQNPDGRTYRPFHDVQMLVDGAAAAALGDLARRRWRRATGQRLRPVSSLSDPWPLGIDPDFHNVDVAIARTDPLYKNRPAVQEVERLYVASIQAAQRFVYMENQYFTSATVADAIAESLSLPFGPEFVIVLPYTCMGWLEETAMGVGRTRILRRLREVDKYGRLSVYYPQLPDQPPEALSVHSKVMVVDDSFVRVGSSNLSNRSMSLDTECDLVIEAAGREDVKEAIIAFRNGLIAEHSGCTTEEVAEAFANRRSAIQAVESLRRPGRSLNPHTNEVSAALETVTPEYSIIDPPRSTAPESLAALLRHEEEEQALHPHDRRHIAWLWRPTLSALLLAALAALWAVSPLAQRYDLGTCAGYDPALGRSSQRDLVRDRHLLACRIDHVSRDCSKLCVRGVVRCVRRIRQRIRRLDGERPVPLCAGRTTRPRSGAAARRAVAQSDQLPHRRPRIFHRAAAQAGSDGAVFSGEPRDRRQPDPLHQLSRGHVDRHRSWHPGAGPLWRAV